MNEEDGNEDGLDRGLLEAMRLRPYRWELVSKDGERLFALGTTPGALAGAKRVIGDGCMILPRKRLGVR